MQNDLLSMGQYRTTPERQVDFGQQIKRLRLLKNIDQITMAESAGVGLAALKNLENGRGTTLKTLIRVLRALGRVEWLDTLEPEIDVNPLDNLRKMKKRERATGTRKTKS